MNEIITRRYFVGNGIAAYFSGFFSKMFRKPRSIEASVPNPTRVLDYIPKDGDGTGPISMVYNLPPALDDDIQFVSNSEPEVLAHPPGSRESDATILFDDEGFFKAHISDSVDWIYEDEGPEFKRKALKYSDEISDEEFAAYQRWLNSDYPIISITETPSIGSCSNAGETEKSDSPGAGRENEGLHVSRTTDEAIAA